MLHKIKCFSNLQSENSVHPAKGSGHFLRTCEHTVHTALNFLGWNATHQAEPSGTLLWETPCSERAVGQWDS